MRIHNILKIIYSITFISCLLYPLPGVAVPGDILFSDNFENGLGNWTIAASGGDAGINTASASSPTRSLYTRWGPVNVTSIAINAAVPAARFDIWIRRGDDSFSEDPDDGEDFILEYLDNSSVWITLESFLGGGLDGEIIIRNYTLPPGALHANLRLRLRQVGGSGSDWDYWHIDDIVITEKAALPPLGVGSCDNFESGLSNWSIAGTGSGGIGQQTFNSASFSMFLRWNTVTATSLIMNTQTASSLIISAWIRRGDDIFSESPDANENLVIEYFNSSATWITLETFTGNGTPGESFNREYLLPADAIHTNFRLRFRQTGGSGVDYDYWHIDDVCVLDSLNTYYTMDDAAWTGTGDVIDNSASNNHGNPIGTVSTVSANPALTGNPGTCGYGNFPSNASDTVFDAVNSTTTPGNTGAITFWYNSNVNWNGGGDRMLLDASSDLGNNNADKFFYLQLRNNGRLRFRLEDSADTDTTAETSSQNFTANTWVHIGITWNLPNNRTEVYIDGILSATSTTNVNGSLGALNSLYIGDNRTTGVGGSGYNGNSANGLIDEFRIYKRAVPQTTIAANRSARHPCILLDHFQISHDGTAVNCQAEAITIRAHLASHSTDASYNGTITLNTSTAHGDWSIMTGNGILNNGAANDGAATYTYAPVDNAQVVLGLKNTYVETVNINVADSSITEQSGSALASEDLNLVYDQTGFNFLANSVSSNISLQIAGKPSTTAPGAQLLELQAIKTSDSTGACEAALIGLNNIELAFECENPAICSTSQVSISGTNIASNNSGPMTNYTPVNLDFGNATDTTATFSFNYPDTGQIQLHARYNIPLGAGPLSGTYIQGASNTFVVHPFAFDVTVTGNPAASNSAGAAFTTAGSTFQVNVRAILWQAGDDTNNDGIADGHNDNNPANNADLSDNASALNYGQETPTESISLNALLDQPGGGNDPGLNGTTTVSVFAAGSGSSAAVRYAEVGIIEIDANVNDNNYLGIGATATGNIEGKSSYVGRFTPDHFNLSAGMITNRVNMLCVPASPFTYMGENFRLEFTLTAQNIINVTTQNYIGGFSKLDPNIIANLNIGAIDTALPTPLTARITPVNASGAWILGIANILATTILNRTASFDGPYQGLTLGINPIDTDGIRLGSYNLDVDNNASNDHGRVSNTDLRFGRMLLSHTFGSELLILPLPLHIEYYNGTQFVRNINDSCSTYDQANINFSNRQGLSIDPAKAGNGTLMTGDFDTANPITLDSNSETGNIDATLSVPAWLQFDWNNDGNHDNDPTAHITFGIYSGSDQQIYIREIY